MKTIVNKVIFSFAALLIFCSFANTNDQPFPYQQFGLSQKQAAAHLLNRFSYGTTEAGIDAVLKTGLEKWFKQQLEGNFSDVALNKKLANYDAIHLTNTQAENIYPRNAQLINLAVKNGYLNKDSVKTDDKAYKEQIKALMRDKGYKPQQELFRQLINQKIVRAAYSQNQLREVMTDFWFNHFNVSLNKNQCAIYIPAFERDVIRPNVFGNFEDLLLATSKSPAMLMYLDNFSSSGTNVPSANAMMENGQKPFLRKKAIKNKNAKNKQGLNENYAREVMELHTLGVDGGYTQSDVTQAARLLTGWTIAPMGDNGYGAGIKKIIDKVGESNLEKNGFVREGDFMFVPTRHDNSEKIVLGKKFAAGGGYQEGVALLKMLAHHTSTAKFIAKKIAIRFVSDHPPQSLIDKMSASFLKNNGDIKMVLLAMVNAPEFWSAEALREKTKSPFEFAISAVKVLDATINQPYQLYNWITKMGQQMYNYQAPTGFPDQGQYWINTGSLLNRMNFGLALSAQKIPGISFDLMALNNHHEPESVDDALLVYSKIFMPERKLTATIERLKPMVNTPNLETKVANAATKYTSNTTMDMADPTALPKEEQTKQTAAAEANKNTMFSQVIGVIIGSPEFQRK